MLMVKCIVMEIMIHTQGGDTMTTTPGQVMLAIVSMDGVNTSGMSDYYKDKVRVRIPNVHGPYSVEDLPPEMQNLRTDDDYLPWASICYPLGTSSPKTSIVKDKEIVYVLFSSTSLNYPLIIGTTGTKVKD